MAEPPLLGRRVAVTRAEGQADDLAARLRALGAEPIICPAIAFAPPERTDALDAAISQLAAYDWLIFTSANGVRALFGRAAALGVAGLPPGRLRVGAVGPATAGALEERGAAVHFVPSAYVAEAVLEQIGPVDGQRILLPQADIAREALAAGLRGRGALVDEVVAYRTVPGPGAAALAAELRAGRVDAITFTSSSTVRYLLDGLAACGLPPEQARDMLNRAAVVCIGPVTARTARERGLRVDATPEQHTGDGLVAALLALF